MTTLRDGLLEDAHSIRAELDWLLAGMEYCLDWKPDQGAWSAREVVYHIVDTPEGGIHTSHIHPHSVISGTTYVTMPEGASAIRFEDPRLPMMMAAPGRVKDAREELRPFIYLAPDAGDVLLWESWLRHEVPPNTSEDERISVSFNYKWE